MPGDAAPPLPSEHGLAVALRPSRWRDRRVWLGVILAATAVLRLWNLAGMPPGLYSDEISVAYNAHSLLETGQDWSGQQWPLLHFTAYGDRPNCLYLYLSIPFQAVGGMNATTARLPAALGSVLTVWLMYVVAGRLFGRDVGLVAAALLAVSPWHLLMSRMAMSSSAGLDPLLVLGAVAVVLWAGLPLDDRPPRPRASRAAVAGLVVPLALYGYWASKLFLPCLLVVSAVLGWRRWRAWLRAPGGRRAAIVLVVLGGVAVAPVVYDVATNWRLVAGRADAVWQVLGEGGRWAWHIVRRYAEHYGPGFLFLEGDSLQVHAMTGGGVLYWFMLPPILIGLAVVVARARRSLAARVLLAWWLLYPLADLLAEHPGPHLLRSSPGLVAWTILAALGTVEAVRWLWARRRVFAAVGAGVLILAAAAAVTRQAYLFFVEYPSWPEMRCRLYADYLEAVRWVRPRFEEFDAVFVTFPNSFDQPFAYVLYGLRYDPRRWRTDAREWVAAPLGYTCVSFGKVHLLAGNTGPHLAALQNNDKVDQVAFVIRPGQMQPLPEAPVHQVSLPNGEVSMQIFVLEL